MTKIAILGLGAMGSRIARRLLAADRPVVLWNRRPEKLLDFRRTGAEIAATPRQAVEAADISLVCVTDDKASRALWSQDDTGLLAAIGRGHLIAECSTLSLDWTLDLAARVNEGRGRFVALPMVGSRPQAEAGRLIFLAGGAAADAAVLARALETTVGEVHLLGGAGDAARLKLLVNAFLALQTAGLAELLVHLSEFDVTDNASIKLLKTLPVCSASAAGSIDAMTNGQHAPLFPIDLVVKDLDYVLRAAGGAERVPTIATAAARFNAAQAAGRGSDNISSVVRLYQ